MDSQAVRKSRNGSFADLRKVIAAGKPEKSVIFFAIIVSGSEVVATLALPLIAKTVVDSMPSRDFTLAALMSDRLVVALLGLALAGAFFGGIGAYLLTRCGMRISRNLKERLFQSVIQRPVHYFDRSDSGALVSRFANDTRNISALATKNLGGLVQAILTLMGSAVMLVALDLRLTITIFAVLATAFLVIAPVLMRSTRFTQQINDQNAVLSGALTRVFAEIRLVKAFTAEAAEICRVVAHLDHIQSSNLRIARAEAVIAPVSGLALTAAMLLILGYGGGRVAVGTLSAGTLTAFILYIFNIVGPIIQFSMFFAQFRAALGSASELAALLEPMSERAGDSSVSRGERPPALTLATARSLKFEKVRFSYGDFPEETLDLDGLVIPLGMRTVIIGPSGSGKTTILALIEQFYTPQQGRILLDGTDIRCFDLNDWRAGIGLVPQESALFAGTVLENICYGNGEFSIARALNAAKAAHCGDFITGAKDLDRPVGEAGCLLSGGQRQRIAIARTFYRDPAILLLDEATSSLDERNAEGVLAALRTLMLGRTTIMITHRLTAIEDFDNVVAIKNGRLDPSPICGHASYPLIHGAM